MRFPFGEEILTGSGRQTLRTLLNDPLVKKIDIRVLKLLPALDILDTSDLPRRILVFKPFKIQPPS